MKISVIQHHINTGVRGNCKSDPIAFAMSDAGCLRPHAGVTHLSWQDEKHNRYSVEVPRVVYEFMLDFDNGRPVRPFDFDLEVSK